MNMTKYAGAMMLSLLLFCGCTWESEEVVISEVDPTPQARLTMLSVDGIEDTVYVYEWSQYGLTYQLANPTYDNELRVIIDGRTIQLDDNYAWFIINPDDYTPGQNLNSKLQVITSSQTGSIADKLGLERVIFERDIVFNIATYPAEAKILEALIENGFQTIKWKKFDKPNFSKYTLELRQGSDRMYFDIEDASDTVFTDSVYIAGGYTAYLTTHIVNGAYSRDSHWGSVAPQFLGYTYNGGSAITLQWEKSPLYGPFQSYQLTAPGSSATFQQYDETTGVLDGLPFGGLFNVNLKYIPRQGGNNEYIQAMIGQEGRSWDKMQYYPGTGRTLFYDAYLHIQSETGGAGINVPYSLHYTPVSTTDGNLFFWEDGLTIYKGDYSAGTISEVINLSGKFSHSNIHDIVVGGSHDGSLLVCNIGYRLNNGVSSELVLIDVATGSIIDRTPVEEYFPAMVRFSRNDDYIIYLRDYLRLSDEYVFISTDGSAFGDSFSTPASHREVVLPATAPGLVYQVNPDLAEIHVTDLDARSSSTEAIPFTSYVHDILYNPSQDDFVYITGNYAISVDRATGTTTDSVKVIDSWSTYYLANDTIYAAEGYKMYIGE